MIIQRSGKIIVNWIGDHLSSYPMSEAVHRDMRPTPQEQKVRDFLYQTGPFEKNYYCPVPSLFLSKGLNTKRMNSQPAWLVRDGLVPLQSMAKPTQVSARLYLPIAVKDKLFGSWQRHAYFYEFKSKSLFDRRRCPTEILLTCTSSLSFFDERHLQQRLNVLLKSFSASQLQKIRLSIYCPSIGGNGTFQGENLGVLLGIALGQSSIRQLRVVSWAELRDRTDMSDVMLFELNDRLVIADDGLTHLCLSRGCGHLRERSPKVNFLSKVKVDVSPFYDLLLYKSSPARRDRAKDARNIRWAKALSAPETVEPVMNCPWDSWYFQYFRSPLARD